MTPERRAAMKAAGAVETTVAEFFDLTEAEAGVVEFRAQLARRVRELRSGRGLSQREMALVLRIAQSRVPAIERGEASIEAIARAFLALGGDLGMNRLADRLARRKHRRRAARYGAKPASSGVLDRPGRPTETKSPLKRPKPSRVLV